jgi:hypothetical protein
MYSVCVAKLRASAREHPQLREGRGTSTSSITSICSRLTCSGLRAQRALLLSAWALQQALQQPLPRRREGVSRSQGGGLSCSPRRRRCLLTRSMRRAQPSPGEYICEHNCKQALSDLPLPRYFLRRERGGGREVVRRGGLQGQRGVGGVRGM